MEYLVRPAWAEIDLSAIRNNIEEIKKTLKPGVKMMAVVKADGYGHGAEQVSKIALASGADQLAVAVLDEATRLREEGITAPILIMGYTPEYQFEEVIRQNIMQTVFMEQMAEDLSKAAVKLGKTAKIHIKLDTGMGRLGFLANEGSVEKIVAISKLPNLEIEGIYTHFASADESDKE